MSARADRHVRSLAAAKDCASLGARVSTIAHVSGLDDGKIKELFFEDKSPRRGNAPSSSDWYHRANSIKRAHASICVAIYRRLRSLGFDPRDSLLSAYREYLELVEQGSEDARISCDRAFDLVGRTDGLWGHSQELTINSCSRCKRDYLAALGDRVAACPFCCLIDRYPHDRRIQNCFGPRTAVLPTAGNLSAYSALVCPPIPRSESRCISAYFPPSSLRTLCLLAQRLERTNQALLNESLIGLFAKYWGELEAEAARVPPSLGRRKTNLSRIRAQAIATAHQQRRDRIGKSVIAGHFSTQTWTAFQTLKTRLKMNNRELLEEALTDLFERYKGSLTVAA